MICFVDTFSFSDYQLLCMEAFPKVTKAFYGVHWY